jgi:hypothetical protein
LNIDILTQPKLSNGKDYTLGEELKTLLLSKRPKFTEVSIFFGLIKDNAFEKIFEDIKSYMLNGGHLKFYLSQPQKGNIKNIINLLLNANCEVYLFKNSSKDFISDFQYKGAIFENAKKATILLTSGNLTMSGLFEGYNTITRFTYDVSKEKDEFENIKNSLFSENILGLFERITKENISELSPSEIPTIEEFTHKDLDQSEPIITSVNDINIDIEIDDNVDFLVASESENKPSKTSTQEVSSPKSKNSLPEPIDAIEFEETKYFVDTDALDVEDMLFKSSTKNNISKKPKASILEKENTEDDIPAAEETKIITKSADLSKTSIFMLQSPKITKKGAYAGEIKIPSYLRDLIPSFWGWPKEYSVKKGTIEKSRICKFKIIDIDKPKNIITDDNVKLFQREGENSFSILSEELSKLELNENDIIRFIKTESNDGTYFTCEVIRTDAKEYPIWEQFCTNLLKGSKRKYGIM